MKLFHGTKSAYLPSIEKQGLVPCYKPGNDEKGGPKFKRWQREFPGRLQSVYVTPDPELAAMFAAWLDGKRGCIVAIDLPDAEIGKLHVDEAGDHPGGSEAFDFLRYQGSIKPEWIVDHIALSALE